MYSLRSADRSSRVAPATPLASGLSMPSGRRLDGLSAGLPGLGIKQRSASNRPGTRGSNPTVAKYLLSEGLTSSAQSFQAAAGAESFGTTLWGLMVLMCFARSSGSIGEMGRVLSGRASCTANVSAAKSLRVCSSSAGFMSLPSLFFSCALRGGCHG